jgi:hypothetical protein
MREEYIMKSIRHLVLLVAAFVCALAIGGAAAAQAASYYVNGGGGSDSNAGTEAKPFNTIKKADSVAKAGDVIYLKGTFGHTYLSGSTGNGTSWNAGGYVTYKVWGDSWVDMNGGENGIGFSGKKYIMVDGFYNGERRIRVYNKNRGFLIESGSSNIKITGCVFNPSGKTSSTGTFVGVNSATYVWVYDNEINNSMSGTYLECIYLGTTETMNAADHVYIHDNIFNVRNPTSMGHDYQAIDIKCVPAATDIRIYRNTFISTSSLGVGLIQISGSAYFYDNYIDMSGASDRAGYLFYVWDGSSNKAANFYAYRNKVVGAKTGILYTIGGMTWSNLKVHLYNNIFEKCQGYITKLEGVIGAADFYHNTFYNCTTNGNSGDKTMTFRYKNNLFTNWGTYALGDTSSQSSTWNGNVYAKSGASATSTAFQWNGGATNFNSLRSSAGQESNGQFGVSASVDSQGLLTAALPVGVNVSSDMSSWPDYNLDFNSKTRSGTWDAGASQNGGGTTVTLQPPTNLRVVQ